VLLRGVPFPKCLINWEIPIGKFPSTFVLSMGPPPCEDGYHFLGTPVPPPVESLIEELDV